MLKCERFPFGVVVVGFSESLSFKSQPLLPATEQLVIETK